MSALRTELADLKIVNEEQKSQLLVKDGELADMRAEKEQFRQLLSAHGGLRPLLMAYGRDTDSDSDRDSDSDSAYDRPNDEDAQFTNHVIDNERKHFVQELASKYGYCLVQSCEREGVWAFSRPSWGTGKRRRKNKQNFTELVRVWWRTGTVGTYLDHPVQGRTSLFRRDIGDWSTLEAIFNDPRVHTGQGYHRRDAHEGRAAGQEVAYSKSDATRFNQDQTSVYYPNLGSHGTLTILAVEGGKKLNKKTEPKTTVNASHDLMAAGTHGHHMIDSDFLKSVQALAGSSSLHELAPSSVCAVKAKDGMYAVLGVAPPLQLSFQIHGGITTVYANIVDVLVVDSLPVPFHFSYHHKAIGVAMADGNIPIAMLEPKLFPAKYQSHPYWSSTTIMLPSFMVGGKFQSHTIVELG